MSQTCPDFFEAILDQIEQYEMLSPGDGWLLAVSGGPDSMAMLYALADLWRQGRLAGLKTIRVAHLNHSLRGDAADVDARCVERAAQALGLEATIKTTDVTEYARKHRQSIETAARNCRYDFLTKTARKTGCCKVVTAHNDDDQVETILHRIVRGTGVRGLAGMPAVRTLDISNKPAIRLIRPMLSVSRTEIETYLAAQNIPYCTDQTNTSPDYTRNRIRLTLLPLLREQFNPQINRAIRQLGMTAEMLQTLSRKRSVVTLPKVILAQNDESLTLDAYLLASLPVFDQIEILFEALQAQHIPLRRMGFRQIMSITELVGEKKAPSKTVQLPNGLQITRRGNELIFQIPRAQNGTPMATGPKNPAIEIPIQVPGITQISDSSAFMASGSQQPICRIIAEIQQNHPGLLEQYIPNKPPDEEIFDWDRINPPLFLRSWREDDRFWPLGASGSKTVGDFFTDQKIPLEHRNHIGLLCDQKKTLCILGLRLSDTAKITSATTRILKISWR